jgi:ferredoxin
VPHVQSYDAVVIGIDGLEALIAALVGDGFVVRGPVVRDGAIVPGDVWSTDDLPKGYRDIAGPGRYRVEHVGGDAAFGWAVGPQSIKAEFFPARSTVWESAIGSDGAERVRAPSEDGPPIAYLGARPCEIAALAILDRVLIDSEHPDRRYRARRARSLLVVAECGAPSATCFCTSVGGDPGIEAGFDLALTELVGATKRDESLPVEYFVRSGSDAGGALLERLPGRPATPQDWARRAEVLDRAVAEIAPRAGFESVAELLARNIDHPIWEEIADRCLACGNCTLACPTCFCTDFDDRSDLANDLERTRRWSSCFELSHSHLHGGSVRSSTASRYRQWMTHKLSTWQDQFGTAGCVGCGRCVAWCPVGIDLTAEVAAIARRDGERQGPATVVTA